MNKVLFFAHLKEEVGKEKIEIDGNGKSIADLKVRVEEEYGLTNLNSVMTAVNEEFVSHDYVIQEGDVIAFIPPVSGG
ncbi:molybdopterin synthase sulfur carrier subunit [Oikeobacillus pervagus]|uniref:Molybdopterin synthase sulfur carrier subunit n=1 Tax=Oikeobacillus pervagus TaxID=1325931 RepID=A0AAJ1WKN2_9BACI|nr:molybdopterin converting factor subunit 1 [Oikeobacillus pervagus]MDQ0215311.1 molybdopterin synthase sulfur carrier subunit [Oikeobacillus pervagus]